MPEAKLITGDATNLHFLQDNSIDLIIAAPPFINRDPSIYGGDSSRQINFNSKKMLKQLVKATKEMERVLRPSGNIWIEVSTEDALLYKYVIEVLSKTKLIHANIVIHKTLNAIEKSRKDEYIYQDMLMWLNFIKDPEQVYFNPFKVKKFKEPIWELNLSNSEDIVDKALGVEYPNTKYYTVVRDIPERLIEMYTKPGWTVLDPFGGSGTVAGVALELGRNAISVDISPEQTNIAEKRISLVKSLKNV